MTSHYRRCFSTNLYGGALEWLICVMILYKPLELLKLYGEGSGMVHAYGLNTSHYFRILVLITMERPIFKVSWVVIDDMTGSCENLMQAIILGI